MAEDQREKSSNKKIKIHPGINKFIFETMQQQIVKWPEEKKYCSIIFDRIELKPNIDYDSQLDMIIGFVSAPGGQQIQDIANYGLVFMVHGSVHYWSKHIAVYFCQKSIAKDHLKKIIEEVVLAVVDTGLIPLALITTQIPCFQGALKQMQMEHLRGQVDGSKVKTAKELYQNCNDKTVNINGTKLNIIYDPRHLLRGLRNQFADKGKILYNKSVARYQDIVSIYHMERALIALNPTKAGRGWFYRLIDEDILPEKLNKKKVKPCIKIFSMCTAGLMYFTDKGMPASGMDCKTMKTTSKLIKFFDNLFDSVNGENNPTLSPFLGIEFTKPLRTTVSQETPHKEFWVKAIKCLNSMKFVDSQGKATKAATITNWITTIRSFQNICSYLHSKNVRFVAPRRFTTDPVENLCKKISKRHTKLTCYKFLKTFFDEMPDSDESDTEISPENSEVSDEELSESDDSESEDSDADDFEKYMRTSFPYVDFDTVFNSY